MPEKNKTEVKNAHWMTAMLAPDSLVVVGASEKPGGLGGKVQKLLLDHGYPGRQYMVNPKYDEVYGIECYADIASLPEAPDLAVMIIGNRAMEKMVNEAISVGVKGMVIFANNYLPDDGSPPLLERLKKSARDAGIPVCGGNGMGFYNYDADTLVSFDSPPKRSGGHISLIAHSGSVMTYLANTDPRLKFNLAVSPGQEISGTLADYMLYALEQPSTRVVAVFAETIRDPQKFIHALETARRKGIPVVVVKVGAVEKSARMAAGHSGAIAGSDTAFQAVCDHYGAIRVRDIDELAAAALIFSQGRKLGEGGLSSLLDSGGLREQMLDLAAEKGVRITELSRISADKLAAVLEYGLMAENPVDAMGSLNADVTDTYSRCLKILNDDPGTGMMSLEFEFRDGFSQYPQLLDVAVDTVRNIDKPMIIINSTTNVSNSRDAAVLGDAGIPVINGISQALTAVGSMMAYRDHVFYDAPLKHGIDEKAAARWRREIAKKGRLDESQSLDLFRDFNLPVVSSKVVETESEAMDAANEIGYPVVLKSARPGLLHKSDAGGVKAGIAGDAALSPAYREITERLGPRCLIAPMIERGVELAFGMVSDPQFGPIVMVCAGGIYIELIHDRKFILAPCSKEQALHHLQSLAINKIMRGVRGAPAVRTDLAAEALAEFSMLAFAFKDVVSEMDLNPVIVTAEQCVIADALVIGEREMDRSACVS